MNTQLPESKAHQLETLDVVGIFLTIQGEGPFTGEPALFIRLAGCNLQCPGCDTDYTTGRFRLTHTDLVGQVAIHSKSAALVVITGGEPLRQNISPLCAQLVKLGYKVQIETNGTLPLPGSMPAEVHVVCSPKTGSVHNSVAMWHRLSYKYVMQAGEASPEDGLPLHALGHTAKPRLARPLPHFHGKIYVQPMDEGDRQRNTANVDATIASVMDFNYCLQLQTHKIIGLD